MKPKTALIVGAAILTPLIVALAMSDAPTPATAAEYVTAANVACFSEQAFDQSVRAKTQKDSRAIQFLSSTAACFMLKDGLPVSLLSSSWGKAHVRVYLDGSTHELWTYSEAVTKK
ncbi:MAG: hypothetical protein HYY96_16090 [Candidatus Tectomicrobia bacterium]|nr:hypothetical protein [Candidatus Tectomicrobia bacterium]